MALDPIAEAAHHNAIAELAYNAFLELRETIKPRFNAKEIGYENPDHARLTIVTQTVRQMDKLSAEHLRKHP